MRAGWLALETVMTEPDEARDDHSRVTPGGHGPLRAERHDHVWASDYPFNVTVVGRLMRRLHVAEELNRDSRAEPGRLRSGEPIFVGSRVVRMARSTRLGLHDID